LHHDFVHVVPVLKAARGYIFELMKENCQLNLRLDECLKLLNRVRRELPKSQYPDLVEAVTRLIEG